MEGEKEYRNRKWLCKQYWDKKLSAQEIGDKCGVTHVAILKWMNKFNINRRKLSDALKLRKPFKYKDDATRRRRMSEAKKKPRGEASRHDIYIRYRNKALRHDRKFLLTELQFKKLTSTTCYYCGAIPSNWVPSQKFNGYYIYNGIDRTDNEKGYTVNNCVACCKICNRAKGTLSVEDFKNWINQVYQKTNGELQCH